MLFPLKTLNVVYLVEVDTVFGFKTHNAGLLMLFVVVLWSTIQRQRQQLPENNYKITTIQLYIQ